MISMCCYDLQVMLFSLCAAMISMWCYDLLVLLWSLCDAMFIVCCYDHCVLTLVSCPRYGRCTTLNECYPERKIFRIPAEDTWVMGLLNTCSINTRKGRQVRNIVKQTRLYGKLLHKTSYPFVPSHGFKLKKRTFKPFWDCVLVVWSKDQLPNCNELRYSITTSWGWLQ